MKSEVSFGSKILTFIKTKPILFALIVTGTVAVIVVAIAVPIALSKKDEESKIMNNEIPYDYNLPKFYDVVDIPNQKLIDFNDINTSADSKFTSINSKSQETGITYDSFCTYLGGLELTNEKEKVYLTYKWVTDNIAYDYENLIGDKRNIVYNPDQVFERKKTVCSGYAWLFTALLKCMGYEESKIKNIQGHSKGMGYDPEANIDDSDTDHEWNAVQIGGQWCLIDSTWGAGYINSGSFQKSYTDFYLCTPAEQFVRSHLPVQREKNLQFIDNPIDLNTFLNLAPTNDNFFEYGFLGVSKDEAVQNICGRGRIVLKYDEIKSPRISYHLEIDNERIDEYITSKKYGNNYYYIDFIINEEGEYVIKLYGQVDPSADTLYSILSFIIKCDSSPNEKFSFPHFTGNYKDNIELIYPMQKNLESGKKYNFKILAPEHDELYLYMKASSETGSNYEEILMDKKGDYFIKNNVEIYQGFLRIGYKDSSGNLKNLVQYNIISE